MTTAIPSATWTRDVARQAVRAQIASVAIDLFAEKGFEAVTVEQIATTAGISPRTFHRYFASKEDVVIGDTLTTGAAFRDAVAQNISTMSGAEAIRAALRELLRAYRPQDDGPEDKRTMRLLLDTPSLRARSLEKHLAWEKQIAPLIARGSGSDDLLRARTLARGLLCAFDIALEQWAEESEERSASDLLDIAFEAFAGAGA